MRASLIHAGFRLLLFAVTVLPLPSAFADEEAPSDTMYRCEGRVPLYTNRSGYGCPAYEPRGELSVAGNDGLFPERRHEAQEAKALPQQARGDTFEPAVCALYEEWLALNDQTAGGFFYQSTQQSARWYELAKMFSAIGVPHQLCTF